MLSAGPWDPADRPVQTQAPWALAQPARSQSGSPTGSGGPPLKAWTAVCGVAAADAVSVLVRSALD